MEVPLHSTLTFLFFSSEFIENYNNEKCSYECESDIHYFVAEFIFGRQKIVVRLLDIRLI